MIRFATPADAVRIAEIHVATWRVAYRGIVPDSFLASLSVEQRAEGWRRGIEANPRLVVVSEREGLVAGWISFGLGRDEDSKTVGEVYAIYVHPEKWSGGIGRDLMKRGEEELWSRGLSRIVVWVLEANSRARRFYSGLHYLPDTRTKEITFDQTKLVELRYEKRRPAALWNPAAAAAWSILLTPAFGAYLHARNADAMGRAGEARANRIWFGLSLVYLGAVSAGFFIPSLPEFIYRGAAFGLLFGWYFFLGRRQIIHVRRNLGSDYSKRSWTKPLAIGLGILLALAVMDLALLSIAESAELG